MAFVASGSESTMTEHERALTQTELESLAAEAAAEVRAMRRRKVLRLNHEPLNQIALRHLKVVGWDNDTSRGELHVFTLMLWGLEEAGIRITPQAPSHPDTIEVEQQLLALMQSDPAWAFQWFRNPDLDDEGVMMRATDIENAPDAISAARRLLEVLYENMVYSTP